MSDSKKTSQSEGNGAENSSAQDASFDVSTDIKKIQEQAEKAKNDYLYLRAEFENYKKHAIKERSDLVKFGSERLAKELLTVLDNFDRALATPLTPESAALFRQGIELTATELKNLLGRHGVAEVATEGVVFDPSVHEALSSEPTDQVPAGHVFRVFQKAYKMHDKLIRPAQVVVAKKPE
ncbi:MAG: nucleotide exchange factor GrpE [Bdellovibrionaceae bacterium]|nr:nucleotide exchange factor GrpE [Pseudobdellovibrionaceae bacterium]